MENKALDGLKHENEKRLNQNAVQLSTLQQALTDKEEQRIQLASMLESNESHKVPTHSHSAMAASAQQCWLASIGATYVVVV